jgi:hypothetical protein
MSADTGPGLIGKKARVTVQGKPAGTAMIVDAKAIDGGPVELTYQFCGEVAEWLAAGIPVITEVSLIFPPAEPRARRDERGEAAGE